MRILNKTNDNIQIAAGLYVPAQSDIPVMQESEQAVRTSPLVQDYVRAGSLEIIDAPVAEKELPLAVPKPPKAGGD